MRKLIRILQFAVFTILITITIYSCSPKKRLHRLVALHPELVQNDTIHIRDTTILPEVRIDTVVHVNRLKDTVTITKEKLTVRIHQVLDTVYIEAEHKADTIIIEKEVPVDSIVYQTKEKDKIQSFDDLLDRKWFWALIGGVLLCLILWLFK